MMFLDCPAYLDEDGARRCGLPAEVRCRFVLRCSDGPLEAATIRCPSGHWFNGPIESLTNSPTARAGIIARDTRLDGSGGTIVRDHPEKPRRVIARPITAPAYYLGRPARIWMTAMNPAPQAQAGSRRPEPPGKEQTLNPAHEPSQALA
jgi:hypothetical protein